jgi:hypothetical protein
MNTFQTRKQQKLRIASYMAAVLLSATLGVVSSEVKTDEPLPLSLRSEALTRKVSEQVRTTKWTVDQDTWRKGEDLYEEAEIGATLLYNTLFPGKSIEWLNITSEQSTINNEKQEFLKRLILTLAYVPLQYKKEGGAERSWPFAIATALTHGQRILFKNIGLRADTVYNWLLAGDTASTPVIDDKRPAASHAAEETKDGNIVEKKLGFFMIAKNLQHGKKGHHRFVNIPFGGLGNKDHKGRLIGSDGCRINPNSGNRYRKIQHGHVYIFADTFKTGNSALLIGIESSAPGKKNMFGGIHSWKSAFTNPQKEKGVTGGTKMVGILGNSAPATCGGMSIKMNADLLVEIQDVYDKVGLLSQKDQQEFFKKILLAPATVAKEIIKLL